VTTNQPKPKKTWRSRIALAILIVVAACGIIAATLPSLQPARRKSLYISMRDGTKIAVDVWLPARLSANQKIPAILRATCYWRSYQLTPISQLLENFGLMPGDFKEGEKWVKAGYALILVDVRGTGASSGKWSIPWSDEEIADLGQVVDWIVAQPWSNGRVGAYGVSYDGADAEMLTMLNHPAVKAVAPQFNELDLYSQLAYPGGVMNQGFLQQWGEFHHLLGANDVCGIAKAAKMDCEQMKYMLTGVRQVDEDGNGSQLAEAMASHKQTDVLYWAQQMEYRDDLWENTGISLTGTSPYWRKAAIEQSGVPMFIWESWLDSAVVDGTLSRYLTFSNRQKVVIGPWSHGAAYHADPFLPADTPVDPSTEEQFQMLVAFFDAFLKDNAAPEPEWGITYYTLGEGTWKTTQTWPPVGFTPQSWYLGPEGSLVSTTPNAEAGFDEYTVDWTATTGPANRWYTGLFKDDVVYPDRAQEDQKLLTYTSAPMKTGVEITGSPVIMLYVASTTPDAAFHVYLEDVAPDGRVTYITEGMLRAVNRKISDAEPPYVQPGPYHTLARADAVPLVMGEISEISFSLHATSVLIQQGHRIRVAIAGADASMFARYPAEGTPTFTVQRNQVYASYIALPMKER
jgi:hypothetical protein